MNDADTTLAQCRRLVTDFIAERQWQRHHQPKNVAMSIAIEAAELMELFQWEEVEDPQRIRANPQLMQRVREESADVLAYLLSLSDRLEFDLAAALAEKMRANALRYPPGSTGRVGRYRAAAAPAGEEPS